MAGSAAAGTKRKKPPTFQHVPANRAKKLKRSWVEVQKIKSKWKAQKRKEGLTTARPVVNLDLGSRDSSDEERGENQVSAKESESEEDEGTESESEAADEDENATEEEVDEQEESSAESEESHSTEQARRNKMKGTKTPNVPTGRGSKPPNKRRRGNKANGDEEAKKPTLRELQALAYSKSSLHTYKSGGPRGQNDARGRGRGRGAQRGGRGRGQPDMRLRMNVMLEKIKRDLA